MIGLITRITISTVFFTLGCLGAIALGSFIGYPRQTSTLNLTLCDNKPCLLDVTPGESTWDSIVSKYGIAENSVLFNRRIFLYIGDTFGIDFFPSVDDQFLGRTDISIQGKEYLPTGILISQFGEPCGVSFYPRAAILVLRYPHALANLDVIPDNGFSPFTPIQDIHILDPAFKSDMQPDICIDNITDGVINTDWRGFSLHAYRY